MKRGFVTIALQGIKFDGNFGGVMRAAHNYNADLVMIGEKFRHEHTDTTKAFKHIPVIQNCDLIKNAPMGSQLIAVDLVDDAKNIIDFVHPEQAVYIFGAEDKTLGVDILKHCHHKIYVPTNNCMNLAATVNVIMYDRLSKMSKIKPAYSRIKS